MRIVLLMEGFTELYLPPFLKRWLDPRLAPRTIRISPVRYNGYGAYLRDVRQRVQIHLQSPVTLAVFGLLDLHHLVLPVPYPRNASRAQRIAFARNQITGLIAPGDRARFHQCFAAQETEAWLLSDPALFPDITLPPPAVARPEEVNDQVPPSVLLDRLLRQGGGRGYKKTTRARDLFPKLDPNVVYSKCPNFRAMLDDMLAVAQAAP